MSQLFDQFHVLIEQIFLTLGYPGMALIMFAEDLLLPILSEAVLPFAGSLVEAKQLNFTGVVISSSIGALLGAGLFYYLGHLLGENRTFQRHGRWLGPSEGDLDISLKKDFCLC